MDVSCSISRCACVLMGKSSGCVGSSVSSFSTSGREVFVAVDLGSAGVSAKRQEDSVVDVTATSGSMPVPSRSAVEVGSGNSARFVS